MGLPTPIPRRGLSRENKYRSQLSLAQISWNAFDLVRDGHPGREIAFDGNLGWRNSRSCDLGSENRMQMRVFDNAMLDFKPEGTYHGDGDPTANSSEAKNGSWADTGNESLTCSCVKSVNKLRATCFRARDLKSRWPWGRVVVKNPAFAYCRFTSVCRIA
ncbi:hypothetical protein B0H19DRAFT_1227894 [Mycena capillaripes]|nr:hypothetical protein B0H19DRAFT_1227894 [Mycena capillaripes]